VDYWDYTLRRGKLHGVLERVYGTEFLIKKEDGVEYFEAGDEIWEIKIDENEYEARGPNEALCYNPQTGEYTIKKAQKKLDLEAGTSYRFETEEEERAMYNWAKETGYDLLVFSRIAPKKIIEEYDIKEGEIVWLSTEDREGAIKPGNIGKITARVNKTEGKVLVHFGIGAVSYLISQNNPSSILNTFQYIQDKVAVSEKVLTAHLNPKSFDEKYYSILCETVPLKELKWKVEYVKQENEKILEIDSIE